MEGHTLRKYTVRTMTTQKHRNVRLELEGRPYTNSAHLSSLTVLSIARFLLNLQSVYNWRQLAQDLVRLLMVFELCGDEICEVT